tara:strand:- start:207 stop:548 length:342 start_codon:yes stop_codon:yes gene_type:complete
MSEPLENYGQNTKRIVFKVSDHEHAKLIVRLRHNSLTQAEFFRAVIEAVNTDDDTILSFISDYVSSKQKLNKQRIKKSRTLANQGQQLVKDLSLTDDEVEDVFDLIAQEFPEL